MDFLERRGLGFTIKRDVKVDLTFLESRYWLGLARVQRTVGPTASDSASTLFEAHDKTISVTKHSMWVNDSEGQDDGSANKRDETNEERFEGPPIAMRTRYQQNRTAASRELVIDLLRLEFWKASWLNDQDRSMAKASRCASTKRFSRCGKASQPCQVEGGWDEAQEIGVTRTKRIIAMTPHCLAIEAGEAHGTHGLARIVEAMSR
jgi:hypothetical protein